jgi:hypothetical protein
VTAVLIVNSDGSERHLVIIGKSKTPRCFKGLKNLPVYQYYYNSIAWMKSDVFSKLMLKLDKKYRAQNRKILLLLDNCSSHPYLNLTNIKLLFLPPNITSRLQPLDAGIIRSFKQRYRNKLLEYIVEKLESEENCESVVKQLNLLKAIHLMDSSLKSIPFSVFHNCFKTCGFEFDSVNDLEVITETVFSTENWNQISETLNLDFENFEEYVNYDNNLLCRQELTDQEIIEMARPSGSTDSDATDIEVEENLIEINDIIPTNSEALEKVYELRLYLGSLESVDNSYYDLLNKFENLVLKNKINSKQTLITQYFAKTD